MTLFPDRHPERIERVALTGSARPGRNRKLTSPLDAVDRYSVGGKPQVTAFACRDNQTEVWKIRLLNRKAASP